MLGPMRMRCGEIVQQTWLLWLVCPFCQLGERCRELESSYMVDLLKRKHPTRVLIAFRPQNKAWKKVI